MYPHQQLHSVAINGIGTTAQGVAVVSAAGTVTAIYLTNAGAGYTVAPTITVSCSRSWWEVEPTSHTHRNYHWFYIGGVTHNRQNLEFCHKRSYIF